VHPARAQSTVRVWSNGRGCRSLQDASRLLRGACKGLARLIRITAALVAARAAALFHSLPSQKAQQAIWTYKGLEYRCDPIPQPRKLSGLGYYRQGPIKRLGICDPRKRRRSSVIRILPIAPPVERLADARRTTMDNIKQIWESSMELRGVAPIR